jgi:hypothetical protein
MARIKDWDQYTQDELLEIIGDSHWKPQPEVKNKNEDASTFISTMRFRPGNSRVPFWFLWAMYLQWSRKPTNKSGLASELKKRYPRRRNKYEVFYCMSRSGLAKCGKRKP